MYGYEAADKGSETIRKTNKTGVPDSLLQRAEEKSGMSLQDVRVHYNSPKPAVLQALAYTRGSEIYVGPGQERHLAHELGHVVQQKEGRVRTTTTVNGEAVNDESRLEQEADAFLIS